MSDAGVMIVQSPGLDVSTPAELTCDRRQHVPSHGHAAIGQTISHRESCQDLLNTNQHELAQRFREILELEWLTPQMVA